MEVEIICNYIVVQCDKLPIYSDFELASLTKRISNYIGLVEKNVMAHDCSRTKKFSESGLHLTNPETAKHTVALEDPQHKPRTSQI